MLAAHIAAAAGSAHVAQPVSTFQAVILGILQGIGELFPVSSLGHTVIFPSLFGWQNVVRAQSNPESFWLAFVVALHVGNAVALLLYFWRDWVELIGAFVRSVGRRRIETPTERLAWLIVLASIPAGILGLALEHPLRVALAKPLSAAVFLIVNGLLLFAAERYRRRGVPAGRPERRRPGIGAHSPGQARPDAAGSRLAAASGTGGPTPAVALPGGGSAALAGAAATGAAAGAAGQRLDAMNYREAAVLGVAQSTALIAGISREGVVMTAGLARGLTHENAARFSFLMATPIILAAGMFKLPDLMGPLGAGVRFQALVGAVVAGVVSVAAIKFLLRFFKTNNLNPFGVYCVLFGAGAAIYLGFGG